MSVHQKLGIILEIKWIKIEARNKGFYQKKWSPKLIFLKEKEEKKCC